MNEILLNRIKEKFASSLLEVTDFRGDVTIAVKKDFILDAAGILKNDELLRFDMCKDITAIDWARSKNRFTVVYILYSFANNAEVRVKADLESDKPEIESVAGIWKSANWYERETFDMYGIKFLNHPDLRRVYMPEEFEHHPLKKDFPLLGVPGSLPLPKNEN